MSAEDDIFALFAPLDRAGPGSAASLRRALAIAGTPEDAVVLDAGCGTGADLPALIAAVPQGRVVALDTAAAFIDRVRARFPQVAAHVACMANPPGGPFDLIWSAGAVYQLGVAQALAAWRDHLKPGGRVAFSDLCWRVADPPAEARAFWQAEGLQTGDAAALEDTVRRAGYRVLGGFWLEEAGWAAYYEPLERRLDGFAGDAALVDGFRAEIALWRRYGASYGYRIVVAEPE